MSDSSDKPVPRKSLMRNLGEFFGHIARGVRTDPAKSDRRVEVGRRSEQHRDGNTILRRTTIDEIEYAPGSEPAHRDESADS